MHKQIKEVKFSNPIDTKKVLNSIFEAEEFYEIKNNKKKILDWNFKSKQNFCKNINLLFNRLIPIKLDDNNKDNKESKDNKDKHLSLVIEEFEAFKKTYIKPIFERYKNNLEDLSRNGFKVEAFKLDLHWRMVVGLGSSHPEETSMIFHHVYGFPYIPGSALKGITRHWVILNFADSHKKEDENFSNVLEDISKKLDKPPKEGFDLYTKDLSFKEAVDIFGTQDKAGNVIFFDAYPDESIELGLDVINSHYPQYYISGNAPGDWQDPVPIKFLVVKKASFNFCLASKDEHLLKKTSKLLKEALVNQGVGSKTSIGYGLFTHSNSGLKG
ncbi:MAG: type III-B CRISPR module RAMP protein Cmr6 [Hydrogenobaculum sp.]|nr:MAG: type III-B CRISPR module RAMP protein Cmr6 [Hydrogenobaculum sp.]HEK25154.1 type III-B CRISPR module RAMP protein Cmr6 [Hydrogenobaculum sp.]